MNRTKIVVGTLLIIVGLAAFGIRMNVLQGSNGATYGMLEDGDLERSAAGLLAAIAGVVILLTAKRR